MRDLLRALAIVVAASGCISDLDTGGDEAAPNADPQAGCSLGCHGSDNSVAPPTALNRQTATTMLGVGAHQAHLDPASTWHRQVKCADCHAVPTTVASPGHMDGDGKAELTFSQVAGNASTMNIAAETCTTWCHGNASFGGTNHTPLWTKVDGTQATCGSCHGAPPPPPHSQDTNCASCHPTMNPGSMTFLDPARHIDGVVDVVGGAAGEGCSSCHGSATSSAPPRDLSGDTARSARGVGAHQVHLATSPWRRTMPCSSCHVVPTQTDSPGHRDGDNVAEVKFDSLNPQGIYSVATATCTNNYCHGTGRSSTGTAVWTSVGTLTCTSCHSVNGSRMSGDHRKHVSGEHMRCSECHADVINANQTIINANLHINGVHEVRMARGTYNPANRSCSNTGCHETESW